MKLRHDRTVIPLPARGAMTIVVVADTHSEPHPKAAKHIAALQPDLILHAGDIGDLTILDGLAKLAPLIAVRGNIDDPSRASGLPDVVTLSITDGEHTMTTLLLTHIAVAGPRIRADAGRLARAERASMVVCGHSHVPFLGRDRGLVAFNAGSVGPRRFRLPIVFGVIDV